MIINLTQFPVTKEQHLFGARDLPKEQHERLLKLMSFASPPSPMEIMARATAIASLALDFAREVERHELSMRGEGSPDDHYVVRGHFAAMIGGTPYLMSAVESCLRQRRITPVYAFYVRECIEEAQDDGSVVEHNVFRHGGFVHV